MVWEPPGNNCGSCGMKTCGEFIGLAHTGKKELEDCPFYGNRTDGSTLPAPASQSAVNGKDFLGFDYDFVLQPFPGEPSARKHIQLFRTELIDKWGIVNGDILVGRPIEPSCPIPHVLRVLKVDPVTGILTCHAVGPYAARKSTKIHDVHAYREIGMEGLAHAFKYEPIVGFRQRFLPSNCMRQMVHSGVLQMVLKKIAGVHVLIEEIQMHSKREKLKDVTIRPGDAVSILDPSGSGKTIVIDGIKVVNSDGTGTSRERAGIGDYRGEKSGGGNSGHRHSGGGGGKNRHGDGEML